MPFVIFFMNSYVYIRSAYLNIMYISIWIYTDKLCLFIIMQNTFCQLLFDTKIYHHYDLSANNFCVKLFLENLCADFYEVSKEFSSSFKNGGSLELKLGQWVK